MRLLADRCIARHSIAGLRDDGHDVLSLAVAQTNPYDQEILALALAEARVVVTEDADFGEHIFLGGAGSPGLVRVEQIGPVEQACDNTQRVRSSRGGTARRRRNGKTSQNSIDHSSFALAPRQLVSS